MAHSLWFIELLLYFLAFSLFCKAFRNKTGIPTNWLFVGMLPALIKNLHRINDFFVEVAESALSTYHFKGPWWFSKLDRIYTVDPANVQHCLVKNFKNYHKGPQFNEIFDVFGEGVLNTDGQLWQFHKKTALYLFNHPRFHPFLVQKIWDKVESGIYPVLDHMAKQGLEVDLQELFSRLSFDHICTMTLNHNPKTFSIDLPNSPAIKALDIVEKTMMCRFLMPTWGWKCMRLLSIGLEKKHKEAWQTLDAFLYGIITNKKEAIRTGKVKEEGGVLNGDILSLFMISNTNSVATNNNVTDKLIRDTVLTYIVAGRETTYTTLSWFFYLLSQNPKVLSKIKEELDACGVRTRADNEEEQRDLHKSFENLNDKLVYLHGALCETLRLYPPVLIEGKTAVEADVLPSGHQVYPNTNIAFHLYAMGRMKSIWGDDCCEFKPERWISDDGKTRNEPSHKFLAFNAGPRHCLGKNMSFTFLKIVGAAIIQNYHIQAVEGHPIVPVFSLIFRMKYGFKAKICARQR